MTAPNGTLRAVRMGMLMSQDDFARAIREAGRLAGVPNDANKRLVQRWESGAILSPRPVRQSDGREYGAMGIDLSERFHQQGDAG